LAAIVNHGGPNEYIVTRLVHLIELGNDESPCRGGVLTTRCILELLGDKVYERLPFLWNLTGAVIIDVAKEFDEKQVLNQEPLVRALHAIRLTIQPLHPALHEAYLDLLLRVSIDHIYRILTQR
jgi:hypothetical protein